MSQSESLFQAAQEVIPGGVNSPVRAFRSVGGTPIFFKSAKGAYVTDADDKTYVDYVGSWGPMILGHADPEVIAAVKTAADSGLSFGAPTAVETDLAKLVCELVPAIEMVRMVSSGTEATMSAIRLARGHTGRDKMVKFKGSYHGHADALLVEAGSGALTLGVPNSPGVSKAVAADTVTLPYNDSDTVRQVFADMGSDIACIIVEPVAGNMNCIPPQPGFLQTLREVCDEHGTLLIFDEVMTGFRVALGGAQSHYDVSPDLTTLGKVLGGGMPVGAFGGKREVMQSISPLGPVYQAGTLSGNPVAMAAGIATLSKLQADGFHQRLSATTTELVDGLRSRAKAAGIAMASNQVGGMFGLFFTEADSITDFAGATACDQERFKRFFHGMLDAGIYLAPSSYEAGFVSSVHGQTELQTTFSAAEKVFATL